MTMPETYTGVKFTTLFEAAEFGSDKERKEVIAEIRNLGSRKLLDRNNGNISVRVDKGMVITPTGKSMDQITESDLVLVTGMSPDMKIVRAIGSSAPSSEARLHWLVYRDFPKVNAIVHFHDSRLLENADKFILTEKERPYGTIGLAEEAAKALKKRKFIILKGHGALAAGVSFQDCRKTIEKAENMI
jgi:ribulose-5-phosphate 4-epimerase/fuculose-1-phosphate aldolase